MALRENLEGPAIPGPCRHHQVALGPFGRGYRRVKVVFDTSSGTPKIIYRQDLSRYGWALGKKTRETWVMTQNTR